jgi:hypothetical protein
MPFNPSDYGWTDLFQAKKIMTLPEQMTKKWWDKKKSTIAKMTHSTGVGESLSAVEVAFKKVEFYHFAPRNMEEAPKFVELAKTFIKSAPVKDLQGTLKAASKLAGEQAKELKKNPLTKSTSKVLEEIAEVGEHLMVLCSPQNLAESLKVAVQDWQKGQTSRDIRVAPDNVAGGKLAMKKIPGEIAKNKKLLEAMADDNDAQGRTNLAAALRKLCRDITNPLGNVIKAAKAGVGLKDFDQRAAEGLYKQMVVISNSENTEEFAKDLSKPKMGALTKKVEDWANEFTRIFAPVEIVSTPKV